MLKSFVIKAFLVNLLIQQVVGSYFYIIQVDKIRPKGSNTYNFYFNYFEQEDGGFNKTLSSKCYFGGGYKELIFYEKIHGASYTTCPMDITSPIVYPLGVGNNYLTSMGYVTSGDIEHPKIISCLRTDDNYKFTTYICGEKIPKDLIEVPKNIPNSHPTATATPTATSTTTTSITTTTTTTTTVTKSNSSLKPTSTAAPKCTAGYCGKKRGNGPTGACCSSSDDCLDTCNSNGKCGVSDETGEPKTSCPA